MMAEESPPPQSPVERTELTSDPLLDLSDYLDAVTYFSLLHLVGNVGDMSGRVAMTSTLSAKNGPTSNVADAVTEFMTESRVGEPQSRVGWCPVLRFRIKVSLMLS